MTGWKQLGMSFSAAEKRQKKARFDRLGVSHNLLPSKERKTKGLITLRPDELNDPLDDLFN